ncbi:MAG: hypothetical protein RIC56_16455 [Pseudomonadales bacterium]
MDLLRAAYLLETQLAELAHLPSWKRRDFEIVEQASIRAMREAADRIEQLETIQCSATITSIPLHQPR